MAKISIKRTTITVPQRLVEDLQAKTASSSKTEAVLIAIQGEIKRRQLARFRGLAGRIEIDPTLLKRRHDDHRLR